LAGRETNQLIGRQAGGGTTVASLTIAGGLKQKCALELGVNYLIILSDDPLILKVLSNEMNLAEIGFIQ
jgi:hypothetical protein